MVDLTFTVEGAAAVPYAAAPLLHFALRLSGGESRPSIHAVNLQCQIRIEPGRRGYSNTEQERLGDLFGDVPRWGRTLRPTLWTHAFVAVPPFDGETVVQLPVPCTSDFNVAAAKYFYALDDGLAPLNLLFSGTIFYRGEDDALQIAQIPWEKEARFDLPVPVWKQMMEMYYPNSAWLRLHKDTFDRLYQYKMSAGLPTWETAIEQLLDEKLKI